MVGKPFVKLADESLTDASTFLVDRVVERVGDVVNALSVSRWNHAILQLRVYTQQLIVIVRQMLEDDAYYVSLTKKLYRPITKTVEEPVKEPDFVVNVAPEPEKVEEQPATTSLEPTLKEKLKTWLVQLVEDESFER